MTQHSHVPKFGNWESGDSVPYTVYFDKARKGRNGTKMINPNDPEEIPDVVSDNSSSHGAPAVRAQPGESTRPVGPMHERRKSKEDGSLGHDADYPSHQANGGSGETHKRPVVSPGNSIERSPLHRQAKVSGRDSPSREGKSSYDSSHGTPGRSRMKPVGRRDETVDSGAAVPKFGEWDESNPEAAEGFTGIFNKVREERQMGVGKVPATPPPSYNIKKQRADDSVKCCCFMWSRK